MTEHRITAEGRRAGQAGTSAASCPYAKGGSLYKLWMAGHKVGAALFRAGRVVGSGLEFKAETGRRAGRGVGSKV